MGLFSLLTSTLFLSAALGAPAGSGGSQNGGGKKDGGTTTSESGNQGDNSGEPNVVSGLEGGKLLPNLARDKAILEAFKATVKDDPEGILSSWTNPDICLWEGIICSVNPDTNNVSLGSVDFNGGHLGPHLSLAGFLDKLLDVAVFHVNMNDFAGGIPSLANLPYIFELDVSDNKLTGPFPETVLAATNLTYIDLRFNHFSGELPPEVFHLDLDVLFLNRNDFTGSIPSTIGESDVLYLTLSDNQLTGSLPKEFSNLKDVREIGMSGNKLTGSLPSDLKFPELNWFNLSGNMFSGSIPGTIFNMPKLESLSLSHNQLSGSLPTTGYGPNLIEIELDFNQLEGSIPEALFAPKSMANVSFIHNHFDSLPSKYGSSNLENIDVRFNKLTAAVPETLCALPHIKHINLDGNAIKEPLGPQCLTALTAGKLSVNGNCIPNVANQMKGCGTKGGSGKGPAGSNIKMKNTGGSTQKSPKHGGPKPKKQYKAKRALTR